MYETAQPTTPHTKTLQGTDPQRELEVHRWMGELQTETDQALKTVLELRSRLSAVTPAVPDALEKESTPQPVLVPLADALRSLCRQAKETTRAAQDVLSRLEV